MMVKFGYKLMSEEHGPLDLVENAKRAEAAGFDFVSISDHFHPWLEAQGHSPFAWSVLGAIAHATSRIGITTGLTCPIIRYHPAIIGQAAATIGIMSRNRFTLALGAGERLNEHVTGQLWPSVPERHEMLAEAIAIMRTLWTGGVHTVRGPHFTVDHAQLYDVPDRSIPIVVGVSGSASVTLAAEVADGIMTTEPNAGLVRDFFKRAGRKGPCYAEVALAYADTEKKARVLAHERFRFSALGWPVNSELPSVAGFESACRFVEPDDLAELIPGGPDVEPHIAAIRKYVEAGYDHIVLIGIGPDQESFTDFFEHKLRPKLDGLRAH
jgi:G6PDH family F420-dependent oxidoreductase